MNVLGGPKVAQRAGGQGGQGGWHTAAICMLLIQIERPRFPYCRWALTVLRLGNKLRFPPSQGPAQRPRPRPPALANGTAEDKHWPKQGVPQKQRSEGLAFTSARFKAGAHWPGSPSIVSVCDLEGVLPPNSETAAEFRQRQTERRNDQIGRKWRHG